MKRRKFAQSLLVGAGISSLPMSLSMASIKPAHDLQKSNEVSTSDGLKMSLNKQLHPTRNKDRKQFILTYDVKNSSAPLQEKIYDLKLSNGQTHSVYMTPINDTQLQAVFNWRLNA